MKILKNKIKPLIAEDKLLNSKKPKVINISFSYDRSKVFEDELRVLDTQVGLLQNKYNKTLERLKKKPPVINYSFKEIFCDTNTRDWTLEKTTINKIIPHIQNKLTPKGVTNMANTTKSVSKNNRPIDVVKYYSNNYRPVKAGLSLVNFNKIDHVWGVGPKKTERKIIKNPQILCDLHNLKVEAAYAYLKQAFINAIKDNIKVMEVITGKGTPEKPSILREEFIYWMAYNPIGKMIIGYRKKTEGSFIVLLKNNPDGRGV